MPRGLRPGMWIYSFMFGDKLPLLPDYIAAGRVPVPSSLVIGIGMGVGFTAIRLLLDFAVFKVSHWRLGRCLEEALRSLYLRSIPFP